MELALLVGQIVNILSPAMPYLLGAAGAAANTAGSRLGEEAWHAAEGLWAKLWPRVEANPTARDVAADVARQPSNEDVRAALRWQLHKLLQEDHLLAQELEHLIASNSPSVLTMDVRVRGDDNIVSAGDVTIYRGDNE